MTVKYNTPTFVRKLQEGDAEAWQEFDKQYRPKILAYLLKMGVSAEDAEDIYHEALVKVLQRIDGFEPTGHFDRWLLRIAVNQCIDYLRRRRRSPESAWSEDALQIPANDLEPSRQAQQNELRQRIDEAIASLPPRQRQVAQLRLREEMKFGEIADVIGGDAASLKSMFAKAKKKLQLQLAAYLQVFWLPWRRLKEFALLPESDAIASYRFTVPEDQAGEYYLWGRVLSRDGQSDSFRVSVDAKDSEYIWDTGIFQHWTWTIFVARQGKKIYAGDETPQKIHLTAGEHTLSIWHRESDTRLDALLLSRPVPMKSGEGIHALPHQPLTEGWVDVNSKEWQFMSNESSEIFTSYIRFGYMTPTLICWPPRRLRFFGQPLELAFSPPYLTYSLSNPPPPKRKVWFYHPRYLSHPTIFFISFGNRSEIFVTASPVAFLSNESGLLAVQGAVGTLDRGFTFRQHRQLRETLLHGSGRLILLASPQGLPRLKREAENILRRYEWEVLPCSHPLFRYPSQLSGSVLIEGMQLQVDKGQTDKTGGEWQVLLVEIMEEEAVPRFLWNLSYFQEWKRGK
jgi:RNA polymerase sigma-70 factor (ECF subfamily)